MIFPELYFCAWPFTKNLSIGVAVFQLIWQAWFVKAVIKELLSEFICTSGDVFQILECSINLTSYIVRVQTQLRQERQFQHFQRRVDFPHITLCGLPVMWSWLKVSLQLVSPHTIFYCKYLVILFLLSVYQNL